MLQFRRMVALSVILRGYNKKVSGFNCTCYIVRNMIESDSQAASKETSYSFFFLKKELDFMNSVPNIFEKYQLTSTQLS